MKKNEEKRPFWTGCGNPGMLKVELRMARAGLARGSAQGFWAAARVLIIDSKKAGKKKKKKKNGGFVTKTTSHLFPSLQTHFSVKEKRCEPKRRPLLPPFARAFLVRARDPARAANQKKAGNFGGKIFNQSKKTQNLFTSSQTNPQQLLDFSQVNFLPTSTMPRLRWSWYHSIPHYEGCPLVWFSLILALVVTVDLRFFSVFPLFTKISFFGRYPEHSFTFGFQSFFFSSFLFLSQNFLFERTLNHAERQALLHNPVQHTLVQVGLLTGAEREGVDFFEGHLL